MSNIAPITLTDGETVPVDHVFNPISTVPAVYRENGDTATPEVGENELIATIRRGKGGDTINKVRLQLRIPVLEESSGASSSGYVAPPAVAYYLQANIEFMMPARSTFQQRKNIRVMTADLLAETDIATLVDSLTAPY